MRMAAIVTPVLRIEVWHGVLLLGLWFLLLPLGLLDPLALFLGGLFMGINFLLLSYAIRYLLAPLAEKRRVRVGALLLVLKLLLLLGLVSALFLKIEIDAASFAAGVTCLLLAIVGERVWAAHRWRKG